MNRNSILRLATVMGVGAIVGFAVHSGNALLAVIAVVVGILLLRLLKGTDIAEDERTYLISEKASRATLQIFGLAIAVVGASLIALKNEMANIGYVLEYLACILLVLYLIFYGYYNKKYG